MNPGQLNARRRPCKPSRSHMMSNLIPVCYPHSKSALSEQLLLPWITMMRNLTFCEPEGMKKKYELIKIRIRRTEWFNLGYFTLRKELFTMFFQSIVILIAVGAAVGDISDCRNRVTNECLDEESPTEVPTTPERLRKDCEKMQEIYRCAKNVYETCPEAENDARLIETLLNNLKETCDENSDTYEVLSRHISCAGPLLNNIEDVCDLDTLNEDGKKFRPVPITDENAAYLLDCGHLNRRIMCYSVAVSKRCGAELKDIVDDLLRKSSMHYQKVCTPDILNELQSDLQDYEKVLLQRDF